MSESAFQARAQIESICAMVAALSVDYDRLQELKDKRDAGHYVAGWNMPGYMPDSEPAAFETADEARGYIADELENAADAENEAEGDSLDAADMRYVAQSLREIDAGEWGQTVGQWHYWISFQPGQLADPEESAELAELESEAGECESEDDARQRIDEDPLSVEIRSGWTTPGETLELEEFCILLCTGGPAVRIRGELDRGEPSRAWVEHQDWGTPWTEIGFEPGEHGAILTYARCFYFGE